MTELGNEGLAWLFNSLATSDEVPLRNLYLNVNGIGIEACKALATFLSSPTCGLESLYLS